MDAPLNKDDLFADDLRIRDTIIHALYLKLRAERETREAIIDAAQSGASAEVLEAIASDPIPTIDEFGRDATVHALAERFSRISAGRLPKNSATGR
jgi:hypothetical protein